MLKQVNVVVAAIILMIHMQNYLFLMLLKTKMSKYSIWYQELMKQDIWSGIKLENCRLDASISNNKQRCNRDKCRYECKELIDKGVCHKGGI